MTDEQAKEVADRLRVWVSSADPVSDRSHTSGSNPDRPSCYASDVIKVAALLRALSKAESHARADELREAFYSVRAKALEEAAKVAAWCHMNYVPSIHAYPVDTHSIYPYIQRHENTPQNS